MDCNRAKEYIDMYADDMLSAVERAQLEQHISACAQCKQDFDRTMALKNAMRGVGDIEPPSGLAASAIKKAKKSKVPTFAFVTAGIAAAALLVVVLVSGIGGGLGAQRTEEMAFDTAPAEEAAEAPIAGEAVEEESYKCETEMEDQALGGGVNGIMDDCTEMESEEGAVDTQSIVEAPEEAEEESDIDAVEESADESVVVTSDGCLAYVESENTQAVQAIESFIEANSIEAWRDETSYETIISFWLEETHFEEFQTLLIENEIEFEGEFSPGCLVEIVICQ